MTVFDPRGLTARAVDFNRKSSTDIPEALITRYQYGERGEMQMCADPRFSVSALGNEPGYQNLVSATDLLQRPVHQVSIDSGESLSLLHADGQPEWTTGNPGEEAVSQRFTYDRIGRLLSQHSLNGTEEILLQTRRYSDGVDNAEEYNCRGSVQRYRITPELKHLRNLISPAKIKHSAAVSGQYVTGVLI